MTKKLNYILIIFLVSSCLTAFALEAQKAFDVFFDGKKVVFIHKEQDKITASQNCFTRIDNSECEALLGLKKVSAKGLESYMKGGANPGAVVCKHSLNGILVLGHDVFGNETTYCKFKDDSYIGNGSIAYYANKNDENTAKQKAFPYKF